MQHILDVLFLFLWIFCIEKMSDKTFHHIDDNESKVQTKGFKKLFEKDENENIKILQ